MKVQAHPTTNRLAVSFRLLVGLVALMVALGAGGCPVSNGPAGGGTEPSRGLVFADATGPYSNELTHAQGEVATIPVAVMLLPGEQAGQRVTVTIDAFDDVDTFTFAPTSREVVLPAAGQKAFITFQATMNQATDYYVGFRVRRTASPTATNPAAEALAASSGCYILRGLLDVTFIPNTAQIPRGGSQSLLVQVRKRGELSGTKTIDLSTDSALVTVSPARFNVTIPAGPTGPVEQTVIVRPAATVGLGDYNIIAREVAQGATNPINRTLNIWRFKVIDVANGPSFAIRVDPEVVDAKNNNFEMVYVTVSSVNNFTGDVSLTYSSDSEIYVDPPDSPVVVNVSPGNPVTLMRRVTRFYGTDPVVVTFRGRSPAVTGDQSATLTLNYIP